MNEITMNKMQELSSDQTFMEKVQNAESINTKLQVLAEYGIVLSEEEFENACDQAYDLLEDNGYIADGELTEKSLCMVAAGVNTAVCGIGVGVGSTGLYIMMAGGGPAVWAVGCVIGVVGICMRGKKKKK